MVKIMSTSKKKFINSFLAHDHDGNTYKINAFQSIIQIGDFQNPNETRPGRPLLLTEKAYMLKHSI